MTYEQNAPSCDLLIFFFFFFFFYVRAYLGINSMKLKQMA